MSTNKKSPKASKRSASPAVVQAPPAKKKRPGTPSAAVSADVESVGSAEASPAPSEAETQKAPPVFKDPNFVHSSKATGGRRTRVWKNLKQIIAAERVLPWKADEITYGTIDAPPSFKPAKKYSDLSGLLCNYTDPHTKIRYATSDEFSRIRILPSDIVSGYLALRKANNPVP